MRKHRAHLLLGLAFFALVGCGDTPSVIFREGNSLRNELADLMVKVNDEEVAKKLHETKLERLKMKWEELRHRAEKVFKEPKDEDIVKFSQMFLTWIDEAMESEMRIKNQEQRISLLRNRLNLDRAAAAGITQPPYPDPAATFPELTRWLDVGKSYSIRDLWPENQFMQDAGRNQGMDPGMMPGMMPGP